MNSETVKSTHTKLQATTSSTTNIKNYLYICSLLERKQLNGEFVQRSNLDMFHGFQVLYQCQLE